MISVDLKNLVHTKLAMPGEASKPEFSNSNIRDMRVQAEIYGRQREKKA